MTRKHFKVCFQEKQIKTALRFYLTPIKMGSSGTEKTMNFGLHVVNRNCYGLFVRVQTITASLEMSLEAL